ncbi:MAG: T9SS type A sorting domain-containing protein, partial [Saprospiraceae bacterium]
LEFDKLVIINNRYSKVDDGSFNFDMKGALSMTMVDTILIDSLYSCNNLSQGKGGALYISNVNEFTMINSRHLANTAYDTVRRDQNTNTIGSNGGGSLRIDHGGTCAVRNAIVSGDTSFFAFGLFCDSINVSNMHISGSPGTYASYDNESMKHHVYTHVSVTEGFLGAIANHANDIFINSVITGLERPNREIPGYDGPSSRTVKYQNTAINYDCGGNCEGTIPLERDDVPSVPLYGDCAADDFIGPLITPSSGSVLVNRVPVLEGFERDLFGNLRGFGGLADLGAVEYIGVVSTGEPLATFDLSVYPNPATEFIRYNLNDYEERLSTICLVNAIGQIVLSYGLKSNDGIMSIPSPLSGGLYFVQFQTESGKMLSRPIVID